jgi:hypothetical protein
MGVMRYNPLFDNPDQFNYQFDYNSQNFFFLIYKKLISYEKIVDEGMIYIPIKNVKKLLKVSLFFSE